MLTNGDFNDNNLNILEVYVDDGYSGVNFERPAFKQMVKDLEGCFLRDNPFFVKNATEKTIMSKIVS